MKLRLMLLGATIWTLATPTLAQDANVEGRVGKLEKEMRAVQREVFPNGAGKFFEPEIKADTPDATATTTSGTTATGDLLTRVDALEAQLATLTGQVEKQGNSLRSIETRLRQMETQMKEQAAAPANDDAVPMTAKPVATTTTTTKPAATTTKPAATSTKAAAKPSAARVAAVAAIERPETGDAFDDSYNYGYRLWEAKFYPEAKVQLQETVDKFPKSKKLSKVRNLLGRSWLDDKNPSTAVRVFYDNYKSDPRGERAPESLFFLGSALTDLNKTTEACKAFEQLETEYPTEVASRLTARLVAGRKRAVCK
jgi:TolA-binding protein